MADTNEELIGGIGVTITGDYSSLKASYADAQTQAEAAGQAVAAAFNSGVADVSDAAEVVSSSLSGIEPAADGAAQSLDTFSNSTQGAGEAASESESSLANLAQQLTAIGEALVITEGLKEFGSEALAASDSITRASIALTTMTGNADQAEGTIKALEELGMQDGLSMPSLLTAAQRMTALLPPGTDVVHVLGQIADGAAAMGTDIESASQRFDMIVNAGNLSTRALTSLGLSLTSVVGAMQQVTGAAGVTEQNITTMFKALDPGDRVAVLETALSHLGGTAEQVAQQTFGGQWQQLANAWEQIMVQVGQAILPVISDLLEFTKTDIAPFIHDLVSGFNELPGPIKDTAVAVGLAAAAIIPLTGIAAAVAIGLNGLAEAAELLGLKSGEAAIVQETEAAASVAQGEAAAAAAPEVAGLGEAAETSGASIGLAGEAASGFAGILGTVLIPGLAAAAFGFTDLQASIKSAQDQWAQGAGFQNAAGFIAAANAQIEQEIKDLAAADLTTEDAAKATDTFTKYLSQGVISGSQFNEAIKNIAAAQANFNRELGASIDPLQQMGVHLTVIASSAQQLAIQQQLVSQGVAALFTNQDKLNSAYELAKQVYDAANNSLLTGAPLYHGAAANAQEVAIAQKNMSDAAAAAGITLAPLPGSMDAISSAANKLAQQTGFVVNAQQEQANEQAVAVSSMDLATNAYNTSVAKLDLLKSALDDANTAYANGTGTRAQVITAEQNLQGAYATSQKDLTALNSTVKNYIDYMNGSGASTQSEINLLQDLADQFGPATAKALGLTDQIAALQKQLNAPIVGMPDALTGLSSALAEATANVHKFADEMAQGLNVGQQYEKALKQQLDAQVALDQETAVLNTGLQGATDTVSLATDAVAAAKAKVDDLTIAFQNGTATYAQVQQAQKALTSAEQELNTALGNSTNLVEQLSNVYPDLTSSAGAATTAIQQQTASLQQDATALQSVAAAVKSVESDMQAAFGAASSSGGTINVQQGYHLGGGLLTGGGDFGGESFSYGLYGDASTIAAQLKTQEQQLYAQGYTPVAIAKRLGVPLTTVLNDLGLNASQASQTKAGAAAGGSAGAIIVGEAPNPIWPLPSEGGPSSGGTTGGGGTTVTESSSGGTSAVDGGSYPAVTAHQAVGEVWAVTTSGAGGGSSGGGSLQSITNNIAQTITQATGGLAGGDQTSQAVAGLLQVFQGSTAAFGQISAALLDTATAIEQAATAVGGAVLKINTTGGTGGGTPQGGTGGGLGVGGTPSLVSIGNNPGYLPYSPITGIPGATIPTAGAGSSTPAQSTVNANVSINIHGASGNTTQLAQQVASTLVAQLRASGARF